MESVLVVAGLDLDRAWPEFDAATGARLRGWSRELLNQVAAAVYEHDVDALVILGNLFDRAATRPSVVVETRDLLSALDVPVLVVPGTNDWIGPGSPYTLTDWSRSLEVMSNGRPTPCRSVPGWSAAAVVSPGGVMQGLSPAETGPRVMTGQAGAEPGDTPVLTPGPAYSADKGSIVVPPLANALGEAAAVVLDAALKAERIVLGTSPVRLVEVDVSPCQTTEALQDLIESRSAGAEIALIRLQGTVSPHVLLPGYSGWFPHPGLTLDLEALSFAAPQLDDPNAETADQRFTAAMAHVDATPRERHQAMALGLLAMSERS